VINFDPTRGRVDMMVTMDKRVIKINSTKYSKKKFELKIFHLQTTSVKKKLFTTNKKKTEENFYECKNNRIQMIVVLK
jgi:hypothetical protein